jgi:hypothetical protein
MKKISLLVIVCSCVALFASWGSWGHTHINRAAVFALPEEMRPFFYNHIDYITEESVGPDLRKYTIKDKAEAPRHYIDIEEFNKPVDSLVKTMKEAKEAYGDQALQKNGLLPWYMQDIMEKLTNAFKQKRKADILFLSADLGHYLGDAHMPLHTSSNHDGQMTNQKGIHAFWESQIPELFGDGYNLCTENAKYINDVPAETWNIIRHSHMLVDSVLSIEKKVNASFAQDKIWEKDNGTEKKNKFNQPIHTKEYAAAYHKALNGMIQRQVRGSISATANFWYTAWVNAGKPDLNTLDSEEVTKRNKANYTEDYKLWQQGKLFGLKSELEF